MLRKLTTNIEKNLNADYIETNKEDNDHSREELKDSEIDHVANIKSDSNESSNNSMLLDPYKAARTESGKSIESLVSSTQQSPGSKVRKILRAGPYLTKVSEMIKVCPDSALIDYSKILKILNVFASVNYPIAHKTGVFSTLRDRLRVGESDLKEVFELFIDIANQQSAAKVKNQYFWELLMTIIEAMLEYQNEVGSLSH